MTIESFSNQLQILTQTLSKYHSRFPAELAELSSLQQDFAAKQLRFAEAGQRLSIGIIGQVKAGKSSFLNALLFNGRAVLPEAATPKTANLTRITHGGTPTLVVHYYTPTVWRQFVALAAGEGNHTEARVARELVDMVRRAGVDVDAVLAKGKEDLPAANVAELIDVLNDYVGNDGRYTALVEATELQLPLPELQGFEVVDTPGMNDPVASRTQKTREFMARCDVVFFLSRCGQFLDRSDRDLLASQLPNKGVKRLILVACQFDNAILDDGFDRSSLAETETNLKIRINRRADTELEGLAKDRELQGVPEVAALLRKTKTPLFASSYAYGFSDWPAARWSKGMQHVHGELTSMAAEKWNGYIFTAEDWRRLGNFQALTAAYKAARSAKQELLTAQHNGLLPEAERRLQDILQRLGEVAENRRRQLRDNDISKLAAQQAAAERRINGIAAVLAEIINRNREQVRALHGKMHVELQTGMAGFSQLNTRSGTDTVERSREVSTSTWYNPFSWGSSRTVYYTTTQSYRYLAVADAIEQVNQYAVDNAAALLRAFQDVIYPTKLRADLRKALLAELDTRDENFNPEEFRATLEGCLNCLELPELKLDIGDPARAISAQFCGEVRDDNAMAQLCATLLQTLQTVSGQLDAAFKKGVDHLCMQLDALCESLAKEMAAGIRAELEQLGKAFADKEQELAHYDEVIAITRGDGEPLTTSLSQN
ncbi:MAG: dynamin family protein [Methylococcales bacterium]|nr:dynamin family protein [Methylococcales bacterium]